MGTKLQRTSRQNSTVNVHDINVSKSNNARKAKGSKKNIPNKASVKTSTDKRISTLRAIGAVAFGFCSGNKVYEKILELGLDSINEKNKFVKEIAKQHVKKLKFIPENEKGSRFKTGEKTRMSKIELSKNDIASMLFIEQILREENITINDQLKRHDYFTKNPVWRKENKSVVKNRKPGLITYRKRGDGSELAGENSSKSASAKPRSYNNRMQNGQSQDVNPKMNGNPSPKVKPNQNIQIAPQNSINTVQPQQNQNNFPNMMPVQSDGDILNNVPDLPPEINEQIDNEFTNVDHNINAYTSANNIHDNRDEKYNEYMIPSQKLNDIDYLKNLQLPPQPVVKFVQSGYDQLDNYKEDMDQREVEFINNWIGKEEEENSGSKNKTSVQPDMNETSDAGSGEDFYSRELTSNGEDEEDFYSSETTPNGEGEEDEDGKMVVLSKNTLNTLPKTPIGGQYGIYFSDENEEKEDDVQSLSFVNMKEAFWDFSEVNDENQNHEDREFLEDVSRRTESRHSTRMSVKSAPMGVNKGRYDHLEDVSNSTESSDWTAVSMKSAPEVRVNKGGYNHLEDLSSRTESSDSTKSSVKSAPVGGVNRDGYTHLED